MSNVGVFPGWDALNKRTVRAPVNPLDKATVVSIYPFPLDEKKCTLQPGRWYIPAGSFENPTCVPVGPSSWWREIDPQQPLLEIPVASILIADSIVRDYCNGLMGCNMGDQMPGLFYVPGDISSKEMKLKHNNLLEIAKKKQDGWFKALVDLADVAWSRTNGNPLSINEMMKKAAHILGIENRDWLKTYHAVNMVRCFACGTLKNPLFPVCPSCRAIDPNYKGDIKFAQQQGLPSGPPT
jgi:hypothetical protein